MSTSIFTSHRASPRLEQSPSPALGSLIAGFVLLCDEVGGELPASEREEPAQWPPGRQAGLDLSHLGMTAQVPIHQMVGGVNRPTRKPPKNTVGASIGTKANKAVTPIPICNAPTSSRPDPLRSECALLVCPASRDAAGCPLLRLLSMPNLATRRASGGSGELALGLLPERGAAHHLGELLSEVCLRLQHRGEPVHLTHLWR
jgi:hypothetical protein